MSGDQTKSRNRPPAEVYDEAFVPALFGPWGRQTAKLAELRPGHAVLDVACGTGAATLVAAELVAPGGSVVGLDPNEEMLAVARRKNATIQWEVGKAEALSYPDASFDAVVSQFGMMFFEDPVASLREMQRVLRPGGRIAVAVCDAIDHSPGYAVLTELLHRLFGESVAQSFRAPFRLGDRRHLRALAAEAALSGVDVSRQEGRVRFASISDLVSTERACAWTLGGVLDDDQFENLRAASEESLHPFVDKDGHIDFSMPALYITATKP